MNRQKGSLSDDKRREVQSMDIDSFTVFLFRWLKDNLDTDRISYKHNYPIEYLGETYSLVDRGIPYQIKIVLSWRKLSLILKTEV